jgi:hypothetical protein
MSEITAVRNERLNGIEIRFPSKPSEEVRTSLKRAGFRWSRPQQIWYTRYSAYKWSFAQLFTEASDGAVDPSNRRDEDFLDAQNVHYGVI